MTWNSLLVLVAEMQTVVWFPMTIVGVVIFSGGSFSLSEPVWPLCRWTVISLMPNVVIGGVVGRLFVKRTSEGTP